jgi:hypothetical protein
MLAGMALTTITGRVRATVRLKDAGAGGDRVVASSWASDRSFPRTTGLAVPFELEAGDGAVYRVDPFEAVVTLPVRLSGERSGVRHEEAWIAVAEEITVEGELERARRARLPPELRARRIAAKGQAALHRLPPRSLQRGESERLEPAAAAPGELATSDPPAPPPAEAPGAPSPPPSAAGPRRPRSKG